MNINKIDELHSIQELQDWAQERFTKTTKLGSLATMPVDVLTAEEVEMLRAAMDGWLAGIDESRGYEDERYEVD